MNIIYSICRALSVGVIIGFFVGSFKAIIKKKYTEGQKRKTKIFINKFAFILKYITLLLLTLGLIWCIYFLILGASVSSQAGYANNMAELIVSVLTVISIIFAFVEFLRRTNDKI